MAESSNFAFFKEHDPVFFQLANAAERAFASDPNTTLIKLRQLGEALAQDLAVRAGIEFDTTTSQADLLYRLSREIQLDGNIRNLFHTLRVEGNKAILPIATWVTASRVLSMPGRKSNCMMTGRATSSG